MGVNQRYLNITLGPVAKITCTITEQVIDLPGRFHAAVTATYNQNRKPPTASFRCLGYFGLLHLRHDVRA